MQANAADDEDDDLAAIPPPGGLAVGSVCRAIKKCTSRAFNRAASAASDAAAVAQFLDNDLDLDLDRGGLSLPSHLPVFANARAGLWHVDLNSSSRVQICRFKSTDGHAAASGGAGGSFPLSRLNLGVAAAAARAGGAVVVDATRKGKRFPDALSRTVPIWAAVVNRACMIWTDTEGKETEKGESQSLFFSPPWVPASEKSKVEGRIEGWARLLLSTGVDLSSFAAELAERPLRPVWVARRGGGEGEGEHSSSSSFDVIHAEEEEENRAANRTTPLYLFSASDPSARRASVSCGCSSNSASKEDAAESASLLHPTHGCFELSFHYEPGGGDDEEGWSKGLPARLFWNHRGELLSRGPEGFEGAAEELLLLMARRRKEGGGAEAGSSATPGASSSSSSSSPASWASVCGTRLAVGNAAAAAAALRCSSSSPSFESEGGLAAAAVVVLGSGGGGRSAAAPPPPAPSPSLLCFRAPVPRRSKLGLLEALPSVVAFASAHLMQGRTVLLTSDEDEDDSESNGNENAAAAAAAVLLACFSAPPRAQFLRAFGGSGSDSRPCGCPAPPRASREEVRARVAAVCGSGSSSAFGGERGGGKKETSSLPPPLLLLSVGKEAAKQLLMFASPPERPGGFHCPACRAGRPASLGEEKAAAAAAALGKGEGSGAGRASGVEA